MLNLGKGCMDGWVNGFVWGLTNLRSVSLHEHLSGTRQAALSLTRCSHPQQSWPRAPHAHSHLQSESWTPSSASPVLILGPPPVCLAAPSGRPAVIPISRPDQKPGVSLSLLHLPYRHLLLPTSPSIVISPRMLCQTLESFLNTAARVTCKTEHLPLFIPCSEQISHTTGSSEKAQPLDMATETPQAMGSTKHAQRLLPGADCPGGNPLCP